MDVQTLKLSNRTVLGKRVRQLRKNGILPVHVYGTNEAPQSLQGDIRVLNRLIPQIGTNIPVSVEVEGSDSICFVREVQRHPVTEDLLHVDFIRVDVSQVTQAEVPVLLVGEAPATRQGGTLLLQLQTILVEALPMNIPASIEVDVESLDDFEKAIYVRDVAVGNDVTVISDIEDMIARVSPPRVEVEETPLDEEGLEGDEEGMAEDGVEGESGDETQSGE